MYNSGFLSFIEGSSLLELAVHHLFSTGNFGQCELEIDLL